MLLIRMAPKRADTGHSNATQVNGSNRPQLSHSRPRQRIVGPIWKRIFGFTRRDLESATLADAVVATGSTQPSRCTVDRFPPEEQCLYAIARHPNRAQSYRVSALYPRPINS